jgi:hypothetical protein
VTEPISNPRRVPARKSDPENAAYVTALKRIPASRPEAVRRAKRLVKDPSYPTPAMLRSMSEFFVERL